MQTTSDPCLCVSTEGELFTSLSMLMISYYIARSERRISQVKEALTSKFEVKDMGKLHYFLYVKITQDQTNWRDLDWSICQHRKQTLVWKA